MAVKTTKSKKKKKAKEIKINPKIIITAVAVCVVIAVIASCVSLAAKRPHTEHYDFGKERAQGVDVSEHNGKINWKKLAEEYDFAFIRVGYRGYGKNGIITEDKCARDNLAAANEAGIPVGIYFYSQATNEKEAEKEAAFAAKVARRYRVELPLMIDFEYPCDSSGRHIGRLVDANLTADEAAEIINAFLNKAEDKGYNSGLYASSSVLYNNISTDELNDSAVIWAADYNSRVTFDVDYTIWQYSERGKSKAVSSKYIDLNYWYNS